MDTSALVAVVLSQPGASQVRRVLNTLDAIASSNFLEAELCAVAMREGVSTKSLQSVLDAVDWIVPDRPLSAEIAQVLRAGYLRGADLWHIASALYLAPSPGEIAFLTLHIPQRRVGRINSDSGRNCADRCGYLPMGDALSMAGAYRARRARSTAEGHK